MENLCTIRCSNKLNQIPAVLCKKCNLMQNVCFSDPIRFSFSFHGIWATHEKKMCNNNTFNSPAKCNLNNLMFYASPICRSAVRQRTQKPRVQKHHTVYWILITSYKIDTISDTSVHKQQQSVEIENLMKLNTSSKRKSNKLLKATHKTPANSKNETSRFCRIDLDWFFVNSECDWNIFTELRIFHLTEFQ